MLILLTITEDGSRFGCKAHFFFLMRTVCTSSFSVSSSLSRCPSCDISSCRRLEDDDEGKEEDEENEEDEDKDDDELIEMR